MDRSMKVKPNVVTVMMLPLCVSFLGLQGCASAAKAPGPPAGAAQAAPAASRIGDEGPKAAAAGAAIAGTAIAGPAADAAQGVAARPTDWPHWRGPTGDAHAPDTGINKDWNKRPPRQLWQAALGEDNHGYPCIAAGRVFVMCHADSNDIVRAFDVKTGRDVWQFKYPNAMGNGHGGFSGATPNYDSGRLYVLSLAGEVRCLDAAKGTEIWMRDIKKELKGNSGFGFNASPLVEGSNLIVSPGGSEGVGPLVVALDKMTGATVWQSEYAGMAWSSTPVISTLGGKRQIIAYGSESILSVDAGTGKTLWKAPRAQETPSPIIVGDNVFVTGCGFDYGCAMFSPDGTKLWANKEMKPNIHTPVYENSYIFGVDGTNHGPHYLVCVEPETGKLMWKGPDIELGGFAVVDGVIVSCIGDKSDVVMFEASPKEYKELGRFTAPSIYCDYPSQCWTPPAIADGKLFIRRKQMLACFDLK